MCRHDHQLLRVDSGGFQLAHIRQCFPYGVWSTQHSNGSSQNVRRRLLMRRDIPEPRRFDCANARNSEAQVLYVHPSALSLPNNVYVASTGETDPSGMTALARREVIQHELNTTPSCGREHLYACQDEQANERTRARRRCLPLST